MLIKHIKINGYRNFKGFEMGLQQFTLIIGENNIGKTNLLNAIGLIFGQDISIHRKRILTIEDFNRKMICEFKANVINKLMNGKTEPKDFEEIDAPEVKIELILSDFNEDQEAVVADWFIDKELTEAKITYTFSKNRELFNKDSKWFDELIKDKDKIIESKEFDIPISYYRYKIYGGENHTKQIDYYFLNMLKMEFLEALRNAERELVSQNDYRLLNRILKQKAETGSVFKDLKEEINKFNKIIKKDKDVEQLKSNLADMMKVISLEGDAEKDRIDFNLSELQTSDFFKRLSLFYGEDQLNIDKNGLGKNNLLYIALILSHLYKLEKESQKIFFRLIAIEEPEAHLHPHLQKHLSLQLDKQICEFYGNPEACEKNKKEGKCKDKCKEKQIIATSHSTHITSHLPLENTAILFSDNEEIKAHYILCGFGSTSEDKKHIRYLKKYLSATNSEMFFARKIILVEGISEQILIPKLYYKEYENSLEKDGITLINVSSIAFRHFLEIINNGYFKKCLVITDSDRDSEKDDDNRADKLKQDYERNGKNLFCIKMTDEYTFEKDILKSNNTDSAKLIIFDAIDKTCPGLFKDYREAYKEEYKIEEMFKLIYNNVNPKRNYKAEFAFNLSERITPEFEIPKYILDGFEFIRE